MKTWKKIVIGIAVILPMTLGMTLGFVYYLEYKLKAEQNFCFTESDEKLKNPGRGFYIQLAHKEDERLETVEEYGHSVVLVMMQLKECVDTAIREKDINRLKKFLNEAREENLMVVFRAAYLWKESDKEPELPMIEEHIKELSEILNDNKDVVLVVQTGMLGLWGEWHGSTYLEDEQDIREEGLWIVKWWQEYLDDSIMLNLRRPYFISLAKEEGCDLGRLGMHNDGLLGSDSDLGTYINREEELAWCAEHLNAKGNGGEMPFVSEFNDVDNVIKEFDNLSITYLNAHYNTEVLDKWAEQTIDGENALNYIEKKLGYRYYVKNLVVNEKFYPITKTLDLHMELANSGFSSVLNRFHLYLVIDDGKEKQFIRLENQGTEKELEIYSASVELADRRNIKIGFCYMDAGADLYSDLPENIHTIEFANVESEYQNGVNYFINYELEDDSDWIYVPKQM